MNYEEILNKVKEQFKEVEKFAYAESNDFAPSYGEVEVVAEKGGENEGSVWYRIFHFVDHNVFIKVNGWYQSYNGTEFFEGWGECSQVEPKQKTITVYE